jgi:hypothetical protein
LITQRTPFYTKQGDNDLTFFEIGYPDPDSLKSDLLHTLQYPKSEYHTNERNMPEDYNNWDDIEYKEHFFASGHMMFSSRSFVEDILPDPRVIFFGEEHTFPLRAYANGYRIFAIKKNVLYTLNKTPEYLANTNKRDWKNYQNTHHSNAMFVYYSNFFKKILKGEEFGPFAAKDKESYEEYIKAMGIDYRNLI